MKQIASKVFRGKLSALWPNRPADYDEDIVPPFETDKDNDGTDNFLIAKWLKAIFEKHEGEHIIVRIVIEKVATDS